TLIHFFKGLESHRVKLNRKDGEERWILILPFTNHPYHPIYTFMLQKIFQRFSFSIYHEDK
ncbi:hypothetical protein IGI04_011479, partial [Brassica rapa subsp. trilocularis]